MITILLVVVTILAIVGSGFLTYNRVMAADALP
jgi:hypothetical protein